MSEQDTPCRMVRAGRCERAVVRASASRGAAAALFMLALGACSSDDGADPSGPSSGTPDAGSSNVGGSDAGPDGGGSGASPSGPGAPAGGFVVASNPGGAGASFIEVRTDDLGTPGTVLQDVANEGTAFAPDGRLFQNGDAEGRTGLFLIGEDGGATRIAASPGKGLEFVDGPDLLASCDVTDAAADLKFHDPDATDPDAAPVATVDLPASCWDAFFDADAERLYLALTDGTLAILDDLGADDPTPVDRLVLPVDADGRALSTNLHGVFVEDGIVLVTDVGADTVGPNSDGRLFVLDDADGTLDGPVETAFVGGPSTRLGNPVDAVLLDGRAIVAEKTGGALLVFDDVANAAGDVAPDYQTPFDAPESIQPLPATVGEGSEG